MVYFLKAAAQRRLRQSNKDGTGWRFSIWQFGMSAAPVAMDSHCRYPHPANCRDHLPNRHLGVPLRTVHPPTVVVGFERTS